MRSQTLVKSMVNMAHDLGCSVVAEGIEEAEVYDLLRALGGERPRAICSRCPCARKLSSTGLPSTSTSRAVVG
ncbi:EAL domain-containing protein [Pseudomonas sp. YJ42]|uniref:EAL domain-containing protein n=1 Tax=Pseudomonas sp. YJ42 TaxID=3392115 RepID=UPI00399F870F